MEAHSSPWYSDTQFSSFWQHYNILMKAAHQDAVSMARYVAMQTKATLAPVQSGKHHPHSGKLHQSQCSHPLHVSKNVFRQKCKKKQSKKKRKKRKIKKLSNAGKIQENQSDTESLYSQMRQGMHIQDVNEDMEVTDDFLAFLEQSKKHREEWKIIKAKKSNIISQEETVNTREVASYTHIKEHPDVTRTQEMQQLYGQASPKIQAMETALQLSFDRNETLYQPKYWPNIPLNVMFS